MLKRTSLWVIALVLLATPALAAPDDAPASQAHPRARGRHALRHQQGRRRRPRRVEGGPGSPLQAARHQPRRQAHPGRSCSPARRRPATASCRPTARPSASRPTSSASTPTRTAPSARPSSWPRPIATSRAATSTRTAASTPPSAGRRCSASPPSADQRRRKRPPDSGGLSPSSMSCDQVLSADMMSPNSSQVSPLKRCSWTDWIG